MTQYQRVQLKQIIRQRCDLENTTFETEVELDRHINDCAAQLHDLLISCAGSNYSTSSTTVTTAAGTTSYAIAAADFYRPIRVSITFDNYDYPLQRYEPEGIVIRNAQSSWGSDALPRYSVVMDSSSAWSISFDPIPDSVKTVNIKYHTTAPVYVNDTDVIAIPYVDYIVVEAAIRIKDKEDRDTTRLERERAMIQKRIEDWGATFDRAQPFRTIDVYKVGFEGDREF